MEIPEEERMEQKKYLKQWWLRISPKLMSATKPQIEEAQRISSRINSKKNPKT